MATKAKVDKATIASEMVSRVLSETVITFSQARAEIERITGLRHDRSVLIRWHKKGAGGVRLDACRFGREFLTSIEAVNRFVSERTAKGL